MNWVGVGRNRGSCPSPASFGGIAAAAGLW